MRKKEYVIPVLFVDCYDSDNMLLTGSTQVDALRAKVQKRECYYVDEEYDCVDDEQTELD